MFHVVVDMAIVVVSVVVTCPAVVVVVAAIAVVVVVVAVLVVSTVVEKNAEVIGTSVVEVVVVEPMQILQPLRSTE